MENYKSSKMQGKKKSARTLPMSYRDVQGRISPLESSGQKLESGGPEIGMQVLVKRCEE